MRKAWGRSVFYSHGHSLAQCAVDCRLLPVALLSHHAYSLLLVLCQPWLCWRNTLGSTSPLLPGFSLEQTLFSPTTGSNKKWGFFLCIFLTSEGLRSEEAGVCQGPCFWSWVELFALVLGEHQYTRSHVVVPQPPVQQVWHCLWCGLPPGASPAGPCAGTTGLSCFVPFVSHSLSTAATEHCFERVEGHEGFAAKSLVSEVVLNRMIGLVIVSPKAFWVFSDTGSFLSGCCREII